MRDTVYTLSVQKARHCPQVISSNSVNSRQSTRSPEGPKVPVATRLLRPLVGTAERRMSSPLFGGKDSITTCAAFNLRKRKRERKVACLSWDRWQVVLAVNLKQMAATCSGSLLPPSWSICDLRSKNTSRTLLPGYHCFGCVY